MTASANPQRYVSPEHLVADSSLTPADRRKRLEQWKLDVELELNATDENMPPLNRAGNAKQGADDSKGELLRRLNNCLLQIEKAA